jgi:hypothetical protein
MCRGRWRGTCLSRRVESATPMIDSPQEEAVHRPVPSTREDIHGSGIPPVFIEESIGKADQIEAGQGLVLKAATRAGRRQKDSPRHLGKELADAFEPGETDSPVRKGGQRR